MLLITIWLIYWYILKIKVKIITINWLLIRKIIHSVLLKILLVLSIISLLLKLVQENIQIWRRIVHYVYNNLIYLIYNIIVLYLLH